MHILIDTDVLLDFAIGREPSLADSKRVLAWTRDHPGEAAVAWHSLSNLAYLAPIGVRDFFRDLLKYVEVPTVGTAHAVQALHLPRLILKTRCRLQQPWHFAPSGSSHATCAIIAALLCLPFLLPTS